MKAVYMKVTGDKYELPIAIADTAAELARIVGVHKSTIWSQISRGAISRLDGNYILRFT